MPQMNGTFVLSLDTELAWGSFDIGISEKLKKDYDNTRYCITKLLDLLNKYKIKATFAFVGHLMLDQCYEEDGVKQKEIKRPDFSWFDKDWFSEDPASSILSAPHWYGTDILNQILAAEPEHEIASHSFSHIVYGDPGCSEECAESDITAAVKAAKTYDLALTTFIFPRNSEGHKNLLKRYGFTAYRGNGNEWYNSIRNKILRRICHFLDEIFGVCPNTSKPQIDKYGLYNIIGNMFYYPRHGIRKLIPASNRIRKAKKGIKRAIKRGEVFHMWFHPYNLASDPEGLLRGLDVIFAYVRMKIDNGQLNNYSIKELCEKQNEAVALHGDRLSGIQGIAAQT